MRTEILTSLSSFWISRSRFLRVLVWSLDQAPLLAAFSSSTGFSHLQALSVSPGAECRATWQFVNSVKEISVSRISASCRFTEANTHNVSRLLMRLCSVWVLLHMLFSISTQSLTSYPLWTKYAGYFQKNDIVPHAFWSPMIWSPHLQRSPPPAIYIHALWELLLRFLTGHAKPVISIKCTNWIIFWWLQKCNCVPRHCREIQSQTV